MCTSGNSRNCDPRELSGAKRSGRKVSDACRVLPVAYPGIFFGGGGFQQIQLRAEGRGQRGRGSGGGSPLVRGSGGSCNLVQEISFHIVKFS